jgi:formylglycine-generating enzyme required for sulfatase activity
MHLTQSHLFFQQPHSQVTVDDKDWLSQITIHRFQSAVREWLMDLYDDIDSSKVVLDRKIGRVLFMALEHEAMHLETLLYTLFHGPGTLSPPVFTAPSWTTLAVGWNETPKPISSTVTLGPALVVLGHDDNEADDETSDDTRTHEFGWDNEAPKRQVLVGKFKIEWRPVTNGEFYQFYIGLGKGNVPLPASWVEEAGAVKVCNLDSHSSHLGDL